MKKANSILTGHLPKATVLKRLEATITMLHSLEPEQFDYSEFVRKGEIYNNKPCGTVCCVAGWYPLYFPKANLQWKAMEDRVELREEYMGRRTIKNRLIKYHGLHEDIISFLFWGTTLRIDGNTLNGAIGWLADVTLKDIIYKFNKIYQYVYEN